jgi:hypothetical protein
VVRVSAGDRLTWMAYRGLSPLVEAIQPDLVDVLNEPWSVVVLQATHSRARHVVTAAARTYGTRAVASKPWLGVVPRSATFAVRVASSPGTARESLGPSGGAYRRQVRHSSSAPSYLASSTRYKPVEGVLRAGLGS